MAIVLPHGVLFRGGEEGRIRKNLIEQNHIDAIIGLPANVFFGTGIPTLIIVLKQKRDNTDVLIIDASKGFKKVGKSNQLQASDIKKIADTVAGRKTVAKYSRVVSQAEIRGNDYNLNIPRYVDSSEKAETWDIYASMFGGIPKSELNELKAFWDAFPNLKQDLFIDDGTPYVALGVDNVKQAMMDHPEVKAFIKMFHLAFHDFAAYLRRVLIEHMLTVTISQEETAIADQLFARLASIPLVDPYKAYQALDDEWVKIAVDLEIIQSEGLAAAKTVDPNMVVKKKDGKEAEVQDGWTGRVIPFALVQATLLKEEADRLKQRENQLTAIAAEVEEIIDSLTEEERQSRILNDANDAFVAAEVNKAVRDFYADIESEEITALNGYIALLDAKAGKPEKQAYIRAHAEVAWPKMEASKDGTYAKAKATAYLKKLQSSYAFSQASFESKLLRVSDLLAEEKELKASVKKEAAALHLLTKRTIENLTDEQVLALLEQKWIDPLNFAMYELPETVIGRFVGKIQALADKYAVTYSNIAARIHDTEQELANLIDELGGNAFDMKGLREFQSLLRGR